MRSQRCLRCLGEPVSLVGESLRFFGLQLVNRLENCFETGNAPALDHLVLGRPVGAAEDRLALRRQEHGQWPAAPFLGEVQRRHVNAVDVGTFLPVHLDAHEPIIEQLGDVPILEGLALHDVTPVARAVADRQEDQLALFLGPGKSLRPPGKPIDGVVGMLEEIGAAFAC